MLAQKAQLVLLQQPTSRLAEATRSYQLPPRRHKAPAPSPRRYPGQGGRPRVARAACKPMIKVFQNVAGLLDRIVDLGGHCDQILDSLDQFSN